MQWFKFYPEQWINDERIIALPYEAQGILVQLISWAWSRKSDGVPDDEKLICRRLAIHPHKWRKIREQLTSGDNPVMVKDPQGSLVYPPHRPQMVLMISRCVKNSEAGRKSAAKRLKTLESGPNVCSTQCSTNVPTDIDTDKNKNKSTPKSPKGDFGVVAEKLPDGFADFWEAYPRKVGKGAAMKAWAKLRPDVAKVLSAIEWQRETEQWRKNNGQFIPHPATYLNQQRWLDENPNQPTQESRDDFLDVNTMREMGLVR